MLTGRKKRGFSELCEEAREHNSERFGAKGCPREKRMGPNGLNSFRLLIIGRVGVLNTFARLYAGAKVAQPPTKLSLSCSHLYRALRGSLAGRWYWWARSC